MKTNKIVSTAVLAYTLLLLIILVPNAEAATPGEINTAIDNGLAWLASVQDPDSGAWHYMDDGTTDLYTDIATTALVVLKFVERAKEKGLDPFDTNPESPTYYECASTVIDGYDFIFNYAYIDSNGLVYFTRNDTYSTAATMMAIAASNDPGRVISTGPLAGKTYKDALQGMMDWMEYTQQKGMRHACDVGGWAYFEDIDDMNPWADQSNSGYATLGIGFASAPPPAGFGLTITDDVLARLNTYIDRVQDPMDDDSYDGGSWYEPCKPYKWVNILKTGNLLYEMALVGDTIYSVRVQNAIGYIQNHWDDSGGQPEYPKTSLGWKDSYQAMFTLMKGLETFGIRTLNVGGSDLDWFDEVSDVIVANQDTTGFFNRINPDIYEGEESTALRTAWALLTLERVVPHVTKSVPVDIKPQSCPNPLNVKEKGVLPVAILGTQDFDVTKVDPASIFLEGVAPLRSSLEDVATPFEPFTSKENCLKDCATKGPDGFMDLTLKFSAQEVVAALGDVSDRECRVLKLTGNLKEEHGGTPIEGEDVMLILKKGK